MLPSLLTSLFALWYHGERLSEPALAGRTAPEQISSAMLLDQRELDLICVPACRLTSSSRPSSVLSSMRFNLESIKSILSLQFSRYRGSFDKIGSILTSSVKKKWSLCLMRRIWNHGTSAFFDITGRKAADRYRRHARARSHGNSRGLMLRRAARSTWLERAHGPPRRNSARAWLLAGGGRILVGVRNATVRSERR